MSVHLHPATRRRMAAMAGEDPRTFFAKGEDAPKDLELSDAERALLALSHNADFLTLVREDDQELRRFFDAVGRAKGDPWAVGAAWGRAQKALERKERLADLEAKLALNREKREAWRKAQAS